MHPIQNQTFELMIEVVTLGKYNTTKPYDPTYKILRVLKHECDIFKYTNDIIPLKCCHRCMSSILFVMEYPSAPSRYIKKSLFMHEQNQSYLFSEDLFKLRISFITFDLILLLFHSVDKQLILNSGNCGSQPQVLCYDLIFKKNNLFFFSY